MRTKVLTLAIMVLSIITCEQVTAQVTSVEPIPTRVFGSLEGQTDSIRLMIIDSNNEEETTQEVFPVINGKFECKLNPSHVCTVIMMDNEQMKNRTQGGRKSIQFFLMPGEDAEISGTWNNYTLRGSQFYDDCKMVKAFLSNLSNRQAPGDRDAAIEAIKPKVLDFIREHSKMEAAMTAVNIFRNKEEMNEAISLFDPSVRDGRMKWFYKPYMDIFETQEARAKAAKNIVEGAVAPDFSLPNVNGKWVKLSDFRGKYVVLDFWGSWCHWCLKGFPDMLACYEKYKDKVEFVGIDFWDTEEKWKAALEKHKTTWTQLRESDNTEKVSNTFGVQGAPYKIVIDKDGKIVKIFLGESPKFYEFIDSLFK